MRENCPDSELVAAYVESKLDAAETESLWAHLADCDECRRETALLLLWAAEPDVPVPVPQTLRDRVIAGAAPEQEPCLDSQIVAAYVEETIDEEERALVVLHMAQCDDCRREVALIELQRASSQMSRIVPADVRAHVVAAVGRSQSRRLRVVRPEARSQFAMFVATAAAILLAVLFVLTSKNPGTPDRTNSPIGKTDSGSIEKAPDVVKDTTPPRDTTPRVTPPDQDPEPPIAWPEIPKSKDIPVSPTTGQDPPQPVPVPVSPPRVRETVAMRFAGIKITDVTGDLQIQRVGKTRREKVHGAVLVAEGDTLIADRGGVTFLLDDYPVSLGVQTQIGLAYEIAESAPAIHVERGEACIDSSAAAARWYVAAKDVGAWIEQTQAKFAVGADLQGHLRIVALEGHLTGKDDYGRPFDLRTGEKLVAGPDACTTSPAPDAPKKAAALSAGTPGTRTFYSTTFDRASMAGIGIVEGWHDKQGEWLVATEKRGVLNAAMKVPGDVHYHHALVVRMRVRTNLAESRIVLQVEDKALILFERKIQRDQRYAWLNVEFSLGDPAVRVTGIASPGFSIDGKTDRIRHVGAAGEKRLVFGDERPYLQIDDVQLATRP